MLDHLAVKKLPGLTLMPKSLLLQTEFLDSPSHRNDNAAFCAAVSATVLPLAINKPSLLWPALLTIVSLAGPVIALRRV